MSPPASRAVEPSPVSLPAPRSPLPAPLPLAIEPSLAAALDPLPSEGPVDAYLGVDVGSVSTNLVLLSPDGKVYEGIYLPTRGQPIEAIGQGLDLIRDSVGQRLHVLGVAVTGSGRHLAAQLLGADLVKNEITCQLRAAVEIAPEVDTIFEIGGQDSKYIHVRDGHSDDFVMNKICAAGTGSFLEEQAEHLGVAIVDEFSRLAAASTAPADLGCQCTVFMHSEVVAAQRRGDLHAGPLCRAGLLGRPQLPRSRRLRTPDRPLDHVPGRGGEQSVRRGRVPADPRGTRPRPPLRQGFGGNRRSVAGA